MTSILLHEYVEQVEKLIDSNRLVEAIEHCRHILHHYPRHIDTYRVMGKALLEKQDYSSANDLFLRILGADPNDFISHVGLSIIYKEERQYDQALWHLERAYEIQPYNVAIQGELRQLYAVETETRPGIIPLTPGALVRLYMKGELYQQAISELRRILAEEPERMDLQVLLAEALWRDDQRIDAEEVCLTVLEELPNCIVLNAILAEIWLQTGRIPEAQKYLQRLHGLTWQTQKSLDRESIPGQAFSIDGAFALPEEAPLEFLETGTVISHATPLPTDDWVGEVSFDDASEADGQDGVVLEPESGMHSYDWLADIGESQAGENVEGTPVSETDWFSQESAKNALNLSTSELNAEWLADLRGEANEEEESGFQPLDLDTPSDESAESDETDWFAEEDDLSDEIFAELDDTAVTVEDTAVESDHDWLNALAEEDPSQKRGSSSLQIDATNLMDDKLMDWDHVESDPKIVKEPKTPFWLSQISEDELEAVQLNPEDALDWLAEEPEDDILESDSDIDGTESLAAELVSENLEAELDDALDWLSEVPDESVADESLLDQLETEDETFGPTAVLDSAEQAEISDIVTLGDTDSLGDADDWLSALTEGTIEEEIVWDDAENEASTSNEEMQIDANTDELAALSDADNWLESASADLEAILDAAESEDVEFPNLILPDMEGAEISEIPDWLYTENLEQPEDAETAMSSENDPQEKPAPEESEMDKPKNVEEDAELSALDWLNELTSDDEDTDAPIEPPIATEGMPSWLEPSKQASGVNVVDEWDSESANIPEWLQEPVELSELDDDALLDDDEPADVSGLTGLLSEMDFPEDADALGLDEMDSLVADWVDEDADGSLTELLGAFEYDDSLVDLPEEDLELADDAPETAVSQPEDPSEEIGLTGLLSNLSLEDELPDADASPEDDLLSDLLADADDDDLSEFLADDDWEMEETVDDPVSLENLDIENVSLTALLSDIPVEEDAAEEPALSHDDWLADLAGLTDEEELDMPEEEEEPEVGLTGMLANLWPDEAAETDSGELAEASFSLFEEADLDEGPADELGLTELLAGIDYEEESFDSRPELPDFGTPIEPSLTEILSDMELEPDTDEETAVDDFGPISAEDTTWLTQLEADTGALQEQAADFDMAEETGLDWLTLPDEPEDDAATAVEEAEATLPEPEVIEELDSTPEDWDDAMSWLEELAAQQEDPVSELPSVAENMLDEELDTDEALKMTAPMETSDADWLADLDEQSMDDVDDLLEPDVVESVVETGAMAEAESPSRLDEAEPVDLLSDWRDDGELSWLDELATDMLPDTAVDQVDEADNEELEAEAQDWLEEEEADLLPETAVDQTEPADIDVDEFDSQDLADDDIDWLGDLDSEADQTLAEMELFGESFDISETAVDENEIGWLDTIIDDSDVEEASDEQEAADEVLEQMPDPDEIHRITGVTDALKADDGLEEAEADLEDALAWLDEIDEPELQDSDLLDEPPPTLVTPTEPHAFPDDLDEEDEVPQTVVLAAEKDDLALALDRLEEQVRSEGIAVPETAVFPITFSDEDLFAALDWIEQEETATEEPEAVDELVLEENISLEDDPEAWLEELLGGDVDLDVDMQPPPIKPSEDAMFVTEDAAAQDEMGLSDALDTDTSYSLLEDLEIEAMPDDPDAAVAWLDQLVSGDEALDIEMEPPPIKPSEDAMFVTEDAEMVTETAVTEPDDDTSDDLILSMEDDPEAWLEQMLSGDMAMDIEMEPPPIKPSEDAMFVTDDAVELAPEPEVEVDEPTAEVAEAAELAELEEIASDEAADLDFASMEDDPEAWLEQMLSGDMTMDIEMEPPPIKPSEDAMFVTADAVRSAEEPVVETDEEESDLFLEDAADDIIAEVPDDPDEAMAWLEQLAARQGADLDELPSVTQVEDDPAMPDWMANELSELEADTAEEKILETAVPVADSHDLTDDDVDSELPDWLNSGDNAPVAGETDWLQSLPDVDMDSWLAAEEEATVTGAAEEVELPDTGPLRASPAIQAEPLTEDDLFEPVIEPSSGAYSVDTAKLDAAKLALTDGRFQDALAQFKELVSQGSGMMAIIAELEQAADAHQQVPALFQVLGDAYMRNGQLQKALASYRSALDQM